jgi:hypothetical protein
VKSIGSGALLFAFVGPYTGPGSMFATAESGTEPAGPLRVWDLSEVPEELAPVVTLCVLDQIWRSVRTDGQRRLIVVDEAWTLLRQGRGADFLSRLAKSARKRLAGLAVITQDADDVLASDLGRTVVNNAATQLLMRQSPQALDAVAAACKLTGAERSLIASARVGEALLLSGETHVAFRAVASDTEHRLCLTGRSRFEPGGST